MLKFSGHGGKSGRMRDFREDDDNYMMNNDEESKSPTM
jgi:hypothetical protein